MLRSPGSVTVLLALLPGFATAGPADELVRLVPRDSTFCLIAQNLRTHVRAIGKSPFSDWFAGKVHSELAAKSLDADKLRRAASFFQDSVGITVDELLDEVIGDAVVFAYQAGTTGSAADDTGLILIRPRKPEVLDRVVRRLNSLQGVAGGELKSLREVTHRGQKITVREKSSGNPDYYLIRDGVFAFTGQLRAATGLVDRQLDESQSSDSPIQNGIKRMGLRDKALTVWLNPRALDSELRARATTAVNLKERAFLGQFANLWSASDGFAVTVHPSGGLEFAISALIRRDDLPGELSALLVALPGESAALAFAPREAMIAVGGRVSVPKLFEAVGSFLPEEDNKALRNFIADSLGPVFGKDQLPTIARGVGPDWAAWVNSDAESWMPEAALVTRLAEGDVPEAVTRAIELGFQLASAAYNRSHTSQIQMREITQDKVKVRLMDNDVWLRNGFRPCFATKGGFLIVATSPAVIAKSYPSPYAEALDAPLLRVSWKQIRNHLSRHREELMREFGDDKVTQFAESLTGLESFSNAFERLDVRYDVTDFGVSVRVWIELSRSLE